jgi:hypothetical protein
VPQARLYGGNGTGASTRFLDKSDFIRLRNLTLGYSLNNKMIEDMGMSSVRLYLTGVNLLTLNILVMTQKPEEMMQELEKSFILHHQPKQSLGVLILNLKDEIT